MRTLVLLPTYQELRNLEPLVEELLREAPQVEVLIIDDASPDGTGTVADNLAKRLPQVRVIHRDRRMGYASAAKDGFAWALSRGYDQVVQMDADYSHQPRYLPSLLEALRTADVALGSRYVQGGRVEQWSVARRLISRAANGYAGLVLRMPYRDSTSGFVAWKSHVLAAVDFPNIAAQGHAFQIELKYRAHRLGFALVEVPIVFWDRVVGDSKLSPSDMVGSAAQVVRLRWSNSR